MKNLGITFLMLVFVSCSKGKSGDSGNPTLGDVSINAIVNTDSSGDVSFTASAANAIGYNFDFGDGTLQSVTDGKVTCKYAASGNYTVNVVASGTGGQSKSKSVTVTVGVKLNLVWSDEFNTPGAPDPTKWKYDIGTGSGGWGNNELEYYTSRPENASISNGTLKIIANKESYNGSAYTSARMLTQGLYSFKYGKIEVMAKLPAGIGTWPAIWMLGNNISTVSWPACGEMDIMEQNGNQKNTIYGTLHYPTQVNPYGDGATTNLPSASAAFHKYSAIWTPGSVKLLVDDVVFYTLTNTNTLPFNQNFFIILNVAMGGNFGGTIDPAFTTDKMEIDYVRVYQ
ncbi:family 16 glycosylhydrolase [Ginsengibacter hankyongi]|nr:family 16 glycosylhydrolase [Ginsengibacter hankyongi]